MASCRHGAVDIRGASFRGATSDGNRMSYEPEYQPCHVRPERTYTANIVWIRTAYHGIEHGDP